MTLYPKWYYVDEWQFAEQLSLNLIFESHWLYPYVKICHDNKERV
jgi:hypothetical protein